MKKPWNRIDLPVYSLSTKAKAGENMNIITYCSAVSMTPKQYLIAVYKGTKSLELIQANPHFILQLLNNSQYNLIRLLGQQSGFDIDKMQRLQKRNLIEKWKGFSVLKDALALIELKGHPIKPGTRIAEPDHELFLCDMISYKNINDGEPLTINMLRDKKIVRM